MSFSEAIKDLADRAQKVRSNLNTEEATKTALILPFIRVLGYDVFNPLEVVPEFVADIADRKGEKIDYAIMQDGAPIMIIECKSCGATLGSDQCAQLHRYFLTLDSSIGILTDGIRYLFFAGADDGKKMDAAPFMEFRLDDIDSTLIPELCKLCKGRFDLKNTLDAVSELKFNRQIKLLLGQNLENPTENFVSYFIREAGVRGTQKAVDQFTGYVRRAFTEFIAEQVDGRLKTALAATSKKEETPPQEVERQDSKPVTTEDEWQAYYLVKSLLRGTVDPERVAIQDAVNSCSITLDGKRKKPIIRLHFNNPAKKRIELIGDNKVTTLVDIAKIDDILNHAEPIRATAKMYNVAKEQSA
ncbi:MAG: uncharacterized protein containing restriction endonuclease-domain [Candidatus Desulfovibrio kirbyi]|uniref:Uncharacterized protein containing restriction endonuclease-domain n=1 Tax=Candidatus Desulfovibrio kirbyi TaxID=2696086 RepID=A0A6L2R6P5_9BACT|nr:MAG: uncharacterized protein containing restriction endonuclease-domain [Candidatus Desulfovibrio kirbyi]